MSIFTGLVGQWFLRRAMELGGLLGTLFMLYQGLPPSAQEAIQKLLTGGWENVTLGALAPLALAVWGYVWSLRSTTKPQIVIDNKQVPIKTLPAGKKTIVEESARTAIERKPTIFEQWFKR